MTQTTTEIRLFDRRGVRLPLQGLSPDDNIEAVVSAMQGIVDDARRDPVVIHKAKELAAIDSAGRSFPVWLYWWLRTRVVYADDPPGVELLQHPAELIETINAGRSARGDCDDRTMLGCAILRALGFRCAFVVMAKDPAAPYEHVFYVVHERGRLVPYDPQERVEPGRWPPPLPNGGRMRIIPVP